MFLVIIPVSDRHILLYRGETPWWGMLSRGVRYGHEWIWHLVKLVNAGNGLSGWDGSGCQWDDQTRRLDGSLAVRSSGVEPSQSQWKWRRNLMGMEAEIAIGWKKKIIIFYNMKCKDVLDKKLRVAGENEITWHESRWIVGLLSDSDRSMVRSLWFGGSVRCSCWIARSWSW